MTNRSQEPTPFAPAPIGGLPLTKRIRRLLLGSPVSSEHMEHTLLPKLLALPVFASDAISSVAYATQQIILALGASGLYLLQYQPEYTRNTLLIAGLIVGLLVIVVFSYWQTIFAYPKGGGSYIVSKDNLGTLARPDRRCRPPHRLCADGLGFHRGRGAEFGEHPFCETVEPGSAPGIVVSGFHQPADFDESARPERIGRAFRHIHVWLCRHVLYHAGGPLSSARFWAGRRT